MDLDKSKSILSSWLLLESSLSQSSSPIFIYRKLLVELFKPFTVKKDNNKPNLLLKSAIDFYNNIVI